MAIALDGSTPAARDLTASTASTVVTASFSPPSGSLVVIVVNISFQSSSGTTPTVTVKDSLNNTYTAGPSAYDTQYCYSGIFTYYYSSAPGSITVTATRSRTQAALYESVTQVLTGAASSQSGAASQSTHGTGTTTFDSSVTATTTGSRVIVTVSLPGNINAQGGYSAVGLTGTTNSEFDTTDGVSALTGYYTVPSPGAVTLGWTCSSVSWDFSWAALEILPPTGTTHTGSAGLSGSGTLGGTGVLAGTAALSGSGTLGGAGTNIGFGGSANLSGSGTLGASFTGKMSFTGALDGTGTLNATWSATLLFSGAALTGTGTLNLTGVKLGFTAGLSGSGTIFTLATGGLVFGTSIASPYAYPLASQVMVAPPGDPATARWTPLGSIGVMTALTYSFTCPGGCDKMTATIMVPAAYRTQLFNPGWQVKITRGGHQVWDGKMDEPAPGAQGWNLTASGTGNRGQDYLAVYTSTWPQNQPDESINNAIARGLPWVNPGIGTPSGAWYGQAVDSGAQTITALLNLICTRGGLTWYVSSQPGGLPGDDLSVFPLPTVPNRLLLSVNPAPRTLGGDINTIYIRYEITAADTTSGGSGAAVYGLTSVQNAASATAHGVMETYIDLSDVGQMTQAAAQAVGSKVLAIYQRASFAGPFTASFGQLMTASGAAIDPGTDQAGTMVRLILADFGYGGEVTPNQPVTFIVGSYTWDDLAQTASIVPYQSVDMSLTGLLSLANTILTPIAAA